MQEVVCYCHRESLPFFVVGKGSNVLFDDRGFNGLVIHNKINFCEFRDSEVYVGAGYSFALLGIQTARKGWAGLEFASGIPASVGGAIYMNAGANGLETSNTLKEVTFVNEMGDLHIVDREHMHFDYRTSCFQNQKGVIVAGLFQFTTSTQVREKQLQLMKHRFKTQPLKEKSAGCVFRNPSSIGAGALIQQCGLKGFSIGGAKVSDLHANFVVNKGNATALQVLELIAKIKHQVKEITGIELQMEIRNIPYDISG